MKPKISPRGDQNSTYFPEPVNNQLKDMWDWMNGAFSCLQTEPWSHLKWGCPLVFLIQLNPPWLSAASSRCYLWCLCVRSCCCAGRTLLGGSAGCICGSPSPSEPRRLSAGPLSSPAEPQRVEFRTGRGSWLRIFPLVFSLPSSPTFYIADTLFQLQDRLLNKGNACYYSGHS